MVVLHGVHGYEVHFSNQTKMFAKDAINMSKFKKLFENDQYHEHEYPFLFHLWDKIGKDICCVGKR